MRITSEQEVNISRFLYELSKKTKSIQDVCIFKIINSGVLVIITERGDAAKLVGKSGSIVKILAKKYGKPVRILEEATNFKEFVEGFISPSAVSGINTLYSENKEIHRVRVPFSQKSKLYFSSESFSEIVSGLYNLKAEIIFD
ncbi:MAG: hypothetical protein ACXACX_15685 [Candidatus Hodarchaeales archaeon]|jgi:transcription antitermination factor NusA-like protein